MHFQPRPRSFSLSICLCVLVLSCLTRMSVARADEQPAIAHDRDIVACAAPSPRLLSLGDTYFDLPAATRHRTVSLESAHPYAPPATARHLDHPATISRDPAERVGPAHRFYPVNSLAGRHAAIRAGLDWLDSLSRMRWLDGHGQRLRCLGSGTGLREQHSETQWQDIRISQSITADDASARQLLTDRAPARSAGQLADEMDHSLLMEWREATRWSEPGRNHSVKLPADSLILSDASTALFVHQDRYRQKTATGAYLRETVTRALLSGDTLAIEQFLYVNGYLAEWFNGSLSFR